MPKYKVTLEDGSKYMITTAEEKPQEQKVGLPGYQRTERKISERQDLIKDIGEKSLGQRFKQAMQFATPGLATPESGQDVMKAMGGIFQRGQATVANPLMALQEGKITEAPKEAWKGLTGQRLGEVGDVYRRVGVPEPISATLGFFATMGITNLATKGKLVASAKKGTEFIKSKMPKVMDKNYVINRAKVASDGLDDLYGGLSKEYDDVFAKIGEKPVDFNKVNQVLDDLSSQGQDAVIKKIGKQLGTNPPSNVNTLQKIKEALRKTVPDRVWSGKSMADTNQHYLKDAYYKLNNIIAEGNDELIALNRRYRDFMQMRDTLGRVLYDADGNVKAKGLENLFKPGAERSKQQFFEKFAQQWPQAQQVMKDVIKFNKRQAMKGLLGKAAMIGGGYEIGRRTFRGLLNKAGMGGGGYSEGH